MQTLPQDPSGNQDGPQSGAYFDSLGRQIATDSQGFDGSTIRQQTQYDAQGRVAQESRPYFLSGGVPQWTVSTYDALNRLLTQTRPDGAIKSWAYHGLSVTTTNALGKTRIVVKNVQGLVASATDALGNTASFAYDVFGNLVSATDPLGNVASASYDTRGRKTGFSDPDLGSWSFTYSSRDQTTGQTDAKGQSTSFGYDPLGRMVSRNEPDLGTTWVYDTAANGIGKLGSVSTSLGYLRTHSYDSKGRPQSTSITIDGLTFSSGFTYDGHGRLLTQSYPSGFFLQYGYNSLGYQTTLFDYYYGQPGGQVFWTANARDAELRLTQQTAGNGVVTTQSFDPKSGFLTNIVAGSNGAVENQAFAYDLQGNLLSRSDGITGLNESFTYDSLSRLVSAAISGGTTKSYAYDAVGNITNKSDTGSYSYPAPGSPQPHAVTAIASANGTLNFTYDGNGNELSGNGRSIGWSSFNKPVSINEGAAATITFTHGPDHERVKQTAPEGTTYYLSGLGVAVEQFIGSGGTVAWREYLIAGGETIALRSEPGGSGVNNPYFHKDHLGSIAVLTDDRGNVTERLSYDPWGKRRYPNGADDPTGSITSQTTRGYTNQEELADVGLIHMNGRVYDPTVGRMLSADPMTQRPFGSQGWDRYAYVVDNPLKYTDPSGYCTLGCFWKPAFHAVGSTPILRAVVAIAAAATMQYEVMPYLFGAASFGVLSTGEAIVTVGVSGGVGGAVATGTLKGAAIGALTAEAFYGVGEATGHTPAFGSTDYAENVAGHAAIGCASSAASGGSCGSGAMAAGFSGAVGPALVGLSMEQGTIASSVVGGVGSVLGGGKFENGAVTGAFGYLFNSAASQAQAMATGAAIGTAVGVAASAGCDAGTAMACAVANPEIVAASTAAGAATGGAVDSLVHGNSLDSQRQTYVYQLVNPGGDILKYGITSEGVPESRYSTSEYAAMNAQMQIIGSYPTRLMGRVEELRLNGNYVIQNGSFPPLTFRW